MLGNKKASSFRGVRSEPTPAPIKAKSAEQKYHDEDDHSVFVSMAVALRTFWARLAINFPRWAYWIEYGGKVDAFIDSENT
jgi:hypothetical protein